MYPSSVVHTGVKSLGCENRIAQPSPIHSWKRIGPCVVSAVKSGASSFMRRDMVSSPPFLLESKNTAHHGGILGCLVGTLVYCVTLRSSIQHQFSHAVSISSAAFLRISETRFNAGCSGPLRQALPNVTRATRANALCSSP